MPYPEHLVQPMREELTRIGVQELSDAVEVDAAMEAAETGTTLLIINSVCGCAAANARPAVTMVKQAPVAQPDQYVTVFAGQDLEATAQARAYLPGIPPSSPFMALLKEGDPVFVLERRHIEGRTANAIALDLARAFQTYCDENASAEPALENKAPTSTFRPIG